MRRKVRAALDAFDRTVPDSRPAAPVMTETETKALEHNLAKAARTYGRAVSALARARARVRKAETAVRTARRTMQLLISATAKGKD